MLGVAGLFKVGCEDFDTNNQVATLQFAVSGALLQVGTGHLGYDVLPEVLESIAETVLGADG